MANIQVHITYQGRVQGVGFRFTVERVALNLGVTGWIKNLPNGNVEVVAESDEDNIKNFLSIVRGYFMKYITNEETNTQEATGNFKDFQIRF